MSVHFLADFIVRMRVFDFRKAQARSFNMAGALNSASAFATAASAIDRSRSEKRATTSSRRLLN
jgi:hypothetical protein